MRLFLIPALLLATGIPMLADGPSYEWHRRPHDWQGYEYRHDNPYHYHPEFDRRYGWDHRHFYGYRGPDPRYQRMEVELPPPPPVFVPIPPPLPPLPHHVHVWFGF
jgi:hypothetical protein